MSKDYVVSDERTQSVQARNIRWTWIAMNYALALDIVYRAGMLGQELGQFVDIFGIWVGASLLYMVLDLTTGGTTPAAFRLWVVPAMAAGAVFGLVAGLGTEWGVGVVAAVAAFLGTAALIVIMVVRRRRRPV